MTWANDGFADECSRLPDVLAALSSVFTLPQAAPPPKPRPIEQALFHSLDATGEILQTWDVTQDVRQLVKDNSCYTLTIDRTPLIEWLAEHHREHGASLRLVGSATAEGARFNFAFNECSLRWRSVRVPLPPVGRGWGELLYLDDELRIQRDVRGDLLVATRVP